MKAAERLNVTQSAVSLRVRRLEDELGRQLFQRIKSGVELTPAGQQFLRFATSLIKVWEEAKAPGRDPARIPRDGFVIGGQFSLWENLLVKMVDAGLNMSCRTWPCAQNLACPTV